MKNIGVMLQQRSVVSTHVEAFVEPSTNVRATYADLNRLTNRCASALSAQGLKQGDRVALLMHNSIEYAALFYGAAKLGLIVVPLNTRLTASELSFILSDSGTNLLILDPEFADTAQAIEASEEHPLVITAYIPTTDGTALEGTSLKTRLAAGSEEEPEISGGDHDNLFIMYTSGTTGLPKGVVHTHESIMWAGLCWANTAEARYKDRLLLPLPMFHVAALTCVLFCTVRGITLVSMPDFDPSEFWRLIVEEKICIGASVPAILNFMRQVPEFAELDAPDFRFFITGAAPMPETLTRIYNEKNIEVIQGYALTESGGGGCMLMNEDAFRKIGSAGKPTMFTQLCIRDSKGKRSSVGTGEILLKGPHMMKEYWNRPEATEEAYDDGWFCTGDIAEIDDENFITIKDRIKDMIISGGENIYPAEVENVILAHPAVTEVAVIGLPDEKWGEKTCAIIVKGEDDVDAEAIISFCEEKLSRYKLPRKVEFVESIPRNPSGKILKRVLREQFI
ncbi:MAG: long-chain fatty acid--CoA ligase [Halioglobus sp.]